MAKKPKASKKRRKNLSKKNRTKRSKLATESFAYDTLEPKQLLATVTSGLDNTIPNDGLTTLREAINSTNASVFDNTINFSSALAGSTIELSQGELIVFDDLTINGNGVTIDAGGRSRVLNITPDSSEDDGSQTPGNHDVTINNLTLTNGTAGGQILLEQAIPDALLELVRELDNSLFSGGAIRANSTGTLKLDNSTVSNSHTNVFNASGGGVFSTGPIELTNNSLVEGNSTGSRFGRETAAASFFANPSFFVYNALARNHVGDLAKGGGIYSQETVTVTNSRVAGNETFGENASGGGVAAIKRVSVLGGSVIEDNVTKGKYALGGGLYAGGLVHGEVGIVEVDGSIVRNNSTKTRFSKGGGIAGDLVFIKNGSSITGNRTEGKQSAGGGIYAQGHATISNSTLSNNSTIGGVTQLGEIACLISVEIAKEVIGAFIPAGKAFKIVEYAYQAFGSINDVYEAVGESGEPLVDLDPCPEAFNSGSAGGGVMGRSIFVNDSTIDGNFTDGDGAYGGALYSMGALKITDSTVSNNQTKGARSVGGALTGKDVEIVRSTISSNSTTNTQSPGGAISGFNVRVEDSTVTGNFTTDGGSGGAIWGRFSGAGAFGNISQLGEGTVEIVRSNFSNNQTRDDNSKGGAIYGYGTIVVEDSVFKNNSTLGDFSLAGAIGGYTVISTGSTFDSNSTTGEYSHGGALLAIRDAKIERSTFVNNSASDSNADGGAIQLRGYQPLNGFRPDRAFRIYSSTIADNFAGNKGGGVYSRSGLDLANSIVLGNSANDAGGDTSTGRGNNLWVSNTHGTELFKLGQNIGSRLGQYGSDVFAASTSGTPLMLANMTDVFENTSNLLTDNAGKFAGKIGSQAVVQTAALKSGTSNPAVDATGLPQNDLDQRGFNVGVKIKSGTVNLSDLGASEIQPLTLVNTTSLNPSAGNTLAEAIIFANSTPDTTDTIRFAPGIAGQIISLTSALPDITGPLNIDGSAGGQRMIIDGMDQHRVLHFNDLAGDDDLKLNDLRLLNGKTNLSGGAINFSSNGNLDLRNTEVGQSEAAIKGGGISAFFGTVTLTDSVVSHNETTAAFGSGGEGGGINAKNVKLYNSYVMNNETGVAGAHGGGIYASNSVEVRDGSVVSSNIATGNHYGGGIYSKVDVLIENSTVENNRAEQGGGVFAVGKVTGTNAVIKNNSVISAIAGQGGGIKAGSVELTNSVVVSNKAMGLGDGSGSGRGGGIFASSSTIRNSTIAFNNSIGDGGGLFFQSGNVNISNTIIASNGTSGSTGDGGGIHHNGSGSGDTLEITNSTITGNSIGSGFANGGGIFSNTNVDLDITNSIVVGNFTKRVAGGPENEIKSFGPLNFHGKNIVGEDSTDFNASAPNVINAPVPTAGELSSVFQDAVAAGFDSNGDGIFDDFSSGHFTGALVEHDNTLDGVQSIRLNTSSNNPAINGTDAPVSLFSFEGNADDGFGLNNGTAIGGLQIDAAGQRGVSGTAVQFTGDSSQFIELDSPLTIGNKSNTVELWVNIPVDAPSSFMTLLGSNGANWGINSGGGVHFFGFGGVQVDGSTNLRDGNWHHLAFVRDNTAGSNSIRIFVDGELDADSTSANSNVVFTTQPRIGLHIANVDPLTGLVDELTIHESALSQEEIRVRASFDVRGNDRVTATPGKSEPAILDLGAYESNSAFENLTVTTLEDIVDPNDKFTSLREAIAFANTGDADGVNGNHDVIDFAPELGVGAIVLTGGQLEVTEGLTIAAPATGRITIDALGNSRILNFDSTTGEDLELENLTLTGGSALGAFGTGGGAIQFGSSGVLTLRGTQVSSSQARIGGGIQSNLGDVVLENSLIFGNSATPTSPNAPTHGGGVSTETGDITVINSTIYGNQALGPINKEAGLYSGGTVTLENSAVLFNRNQDAGNGGAIYAGGVFSRFSPTITNSIILGNNLNQYAEIRTEQSQSLIFAGHNIVGENQAGFNTTGLTNVQNAYISDVFYRGGDLRESDDPNLLPSLELFRSASNPALDSGDNSLVTTTTDVNGNARLVDIAGVTNGLGTVDLGPIESQSNSQEHRSVVVTTSVDVVDPFDYETSLREAIQFAEDLEAGPLRNGDADGDRFDRDTVTFAEGPGQHFSVPRTITLEGIGLDGGELLEFKALSSLSINGPSAELTIDANQTGRIFNFGTETFVGETSQFAGGHLFTLKGLTLANGSADFEGGAILVGSNFSAAGGAEIQFLTLTDVVIRDSFAGERGGAIAAEHALVSIRNSALVSNVTGGVDFVDEGGSAIFFDNSFGEITNSTISGNESELGLGAIVTKASNTQTSLTFLNSTIADNTGIGVQANAFGTSDLVFMGWGNTLIANNSNGNFSTSGAGNVVEIVLNSISDDGTTNFASSDVDSFDNTDPLLSPLSTATWTHALKPGSPAIDTGSERDGFANLVAGTGATSNTSATDVQRPVSNLINNASIREATYLSTQETNAESWVTAAVGPASSDYFENGGVVPILEFDFNETSHLFEEVAIWGYTEAAVNDIKSFKLEFSFDQGENFFASVELEKPIFSSTDFVHVLPLGGKFNANYIRMTITDNHGGNRVGFNEIRFIEKNTDQRGEDRIVDGDGDADARIDIGAFEAPVPTAQTFVVDVLDDIDDGIVTPGNLSIREAVRLANENIGFTDTIGFDPSVFFDDAVIGLTSSLNINESVTISGFTDRRLWISGIEVFGTGQAVRIFNLGGAGANTYTIENVGLTNAFADVSVGAGGAISLSDGDDSLVVDNVEFLGNSANGGGAIFVAGADYLIKNSSFEFNEANFSGSAILAFNADGLIINSTFSDNTSNTGSAAVFAQTNGSSVATTEIRNSTIAFNNGAGIQSFAGDTSSSTIEIGNSIVSNNTGANAAFGATITSLGNNISDDGSTAFNSASDLTNTDPLLTPLATIASGKSRSHGLSPGSLAIDSGSDALALDENGNSLTTDQLGESRFVDGNGDGAATVDVGAVESEFVDPFVLGDADLNGVVNFLDIQPFIDLLSSGTFLNEADIDRNGVVNFLDISPFIGILASGGSAQSSFAFSSSVAPVISSESVVTSQPILVESPVISAASLVSVAQPASTASVASSVEVPITNETDFAPDPATDSLASPVAESSQLPTVDVTIAADAPVDTDSGPVAFAPVDYRSLKDRHSSLRGSQSDRPLVLRRSLAANTDRPDFARESRDQRRSANDSIERSFSTAAELFDANPESLDEVFDFQLEETFAGRSE